MKESGFSEDVRKVGGIDLPTIQKHINFWFSQSLDLHGSEVSSNAATYFTNGLKGRAEEDKHQDDHVLGGDVYLLDVGGRARPARSGRKCRCATRSTRCCATGTSRTAAAASSAGTSRSPATASTSSFTLPDRKFNRQIGVFAGLHFDPSGQPRRTPRRGSGGATSGCRPPPTRST